MNILQQHNENVAQIERWIVDNGFSRHNQIKTVDGDHSHNFHTWVRGRNVLIEFVRQPIPGCANPRPMVDLYIPLDTTNDMDETRKAIEAYANTK